MKTNFKNKNKGFTIVELIVVMAIIAILILIAVPTFTKYIENANKTAETATANTLYTSSVTAVLKDSVSQTYTTVTTPTTTRPYIEIGSTTLLTKDILDGVDGTVTLKVYAYNPFIPTLPRDNSGAWEVFVKVTNGRVDTSGDVYFYAPKNNHFYENGHLQ